MNPRSTAILFVVAALVVGLVWWNENVRKGQAEEAEARAKALFPEVDADDVAWIALTTTDGKAARLERREGAFRLVEPLDSAVEGTAIDGIVSALAEVTSEAVIESPQAPAVYGLGEDAHEVRFGAGEAEHALRVGAKTPVGSNSYASRDGEDAVYTIPSYRAGALRRSLLDLRDKRVLRFDREAVSELELSWPAASVRLERGEDGWRMTAPLEDAADEATVDGLLSDLAFLRAEGFVDSPPPDAELGLDRPAFEARLTVPAETEGGGEGAPPRITHLLVGRELDDGQHRPARGREAVVYRIPVERLDDFPRTVAAYRFKELARFVASDARQLEIGFHDPEAGAHVVIAEHGDDGWGSSPETMAPGRAARMVAELAALRATDIVAESMGDAELGALGLDPPAVSLRVRGVAEGDADVGAVLAEVWLGKADADRGIVARAAGGERVYRIDFELAEHLPISLEAFRNRFLSKEDEPEPPSP